MSTRLLLADDQALVRGALAALLSLEEDLEVVAEVGRGDEVVAAAREHAVDVALLDVEMPGVDGLAATAALRAGASGFVVTPPPRRWPPRCARCTPGAAWSTPRWPPTRWSRGSPR